MNDDGYRKFFGIDLHSILDRYPGSEDILNKIAGKTTPPLVICVRANKEWAQESMPDATEEQLKESAFLDEDLAFGDESHAEMDRRGFEEYLSYRMEVAVEFGADENLLRAIRELTPTYLLAKPGKIRIIVNTTDEAGEPTGTIEAISNQGIVEISSEDLKKPETITRH